MSTKLLKQLIREELILGFPNFVLDDAADEARKKKKKGLMKSINQRSISPKDKRLQMQALDKQLKKAKTGVKDYLTDVVKDLIHEL